jgi:Holliday junction resolvase RusA-like endonuclease
MAAQLMDEEVIEISSNSSNESDVGIIPVFNLTMMGAPKSLPRVRFFQGGLFNSAKPQIDAMRRAAQAALPDIQNAPLFPTGTAVDVIIYFFLKRPKSDFVGNRRMPGNLRPQAIASQIVPIGPDIDNLAKLVLDSLNGVVYDDDKQVVNLELHKLRDNEMMCNGRTHVICTIHQNNINQNVLT